MKTLAARLEEKITKGAEDPTIWQVLIDAVDKMEREHKGLKNRLEDTAGCLERLMKAVDTAATVRGRMTGEEGRALTEAQSYLQMARAPLKVWLTGGRL